MYYTKLAHLITVGLDPDYLDRDLPDLWNILVAGQLVIPSMRQSTTFRLSPLNNPSGHPITDCSESFLLLRSGNAFKSPSPWFLTHFSRLIPYCVSYPVPYLVQPKTRYDSVAHQIMYLTFTWFIKVDSVDSSSPMTHQSDISPDLYQAQLWIAAIVLLCIMGDHGPASHFILVQDGNQNTCAFIARTFFFCPNIPGCAPSSVCSYRIFWISAEALGQ